MILNNLTSLYCDSCYNVLPTLNENSVDLFLTSPPYDGIRQYNGKAIVDLHLLGINMFRLLKDGGMAIVILNDQTKDCAKSLTTFRTVIDWCDNIGFRYWETLIYQRNGTPGGWWQKRFRIDHEYILCFLKGNKPKYFNKEPLKIPCKLAGETCWSKQHGHRTTAGNIKHNERWYNSETKCRGTIWNYSKEVALENRFNKIKKKHPAPFPDQMAIDIITAFTEENDLVVDPMAGSGSTGVACNKLNRHCILIDNDINYCNIIQQRLTNANV